MRASVAAQKVRLFAYLSCLAVFFLVVAAFNAVLPGFAFADEGSDDAPTVFVECPAVALGSTTEAKATVTGFPADESVQYAWRCSKNGGETWSVVAQTTLAAWSIQVTEEKATYLWELVASSESVSARCSFWVSVSHLGEIFTVNYDDESAQTGGCISYQVTVDSENGYPGEAMVVDGSKYRASSSSPELVFDQVVCSETGCFYAVTCVDGLAFEGNQDLYSVRFSHDLDGMSVSQKTQDDGSAAVGPYAFYGCTNLKSVTFDSSKVDGIADYAFAECSSLEMVEFADGLVMEKKGIYTYAFANCVSLKSIKIPAILSSRRRGDFFDKYNSLLNTRFRSGYEPYWHSRVTCVENAGLAPEVFDGCMNLESIVFEAGNPVGLFAYWGESGCGLRYLTNLKTVVFEAAQPYFGNPDGSIVNQAPVIVWGDGVDDGGSKIEGGDPTFYYAVDYYYSQDDMNADDDAGTNRLSRVEYARGASVSSIQAGDASALADSMPDRTLYAQNESDGVVLDPNLAALQAEYDGVSGFEDADQYSWVWHLTSSQSRRSGLSDSCKAYLAKADDLSCARIEANADSENQIEALYRASVQNFSQGEIQDTLFSIRFYSSSVWNSIYQFDQNLTAKQRLQRKTNLVNMWNPLNASEKMTPWFFTDGGGLLTLVNQMQLYDGAGNKLDVTDASLFTVTYQTYNNGVYEEVDPTASLPSGPLLMTITPNPESGYDPSTCLQEWILVNGHSGTVLERYTDDSSSTWRAAIYGNGSTSLARESFDNGSGSFAVCVSGGDATSALLGLSYAGLSDGPVNVASSDEGYGFGLALGNDDADKSAFYRNGEVTDTSNLLKFTSDSYEPSAFANASYAAFERRKSSVGLGSSEWGSSALLVNPSYLEDSSAAAASFAYTQSAPVFYTERDGSISDSTLSCLKKFSEVVLVGDEVMVSGSVEKQVTSALGSSGSVIRITGLASDGGKDEVAVGNACALSIAMADYLVDSASTPLTRKSVSIVIADGSNVVSDVVGAQNFSGHEDGITLVVTTSADAKTVAQYVIDHRTEISNIRLFGRSGAAANTGSFVLYSNQDDVETGALVALTVEDWESESEDVQSLDSDDLIELYGVLFKSDADHVLSDPVRVWGSKSIASGTYVGRDTDSSAIAYELKDEVGAPGIAVEAPTATSGLVYNGAEQIGVRSATGYVVTGGLAKDAGSYSAVATLEQGYTWPNGSTDAKVIKWSIAQSAQSGGSVTLSSQRATYTGQAIVPVVESVLLSDGTRIASSGYDISYSKGSNSTSNPVGSMIDAGEYTVIITLKGNYSGTFTASFTIDPASNQGGGTTNRDSSSTSGSSSTGSQSSSGTSNTSSTAAASTATAAATAESSDVMTANGSTGSSLYWVSEDGWLVFGAPGNPEDYDFNAKTSTSGGFSLFGSEMSVIDYLLLLICVAALVGAITFAAKAPKETEDQISAGEANE